MTQQGRGLSTEKNKFVLKVPMKRKIFTDIGMFLNQFNSCRMKPEVD